MAENTTNSKQIAKNTLMLYFRMIFLTVISLYTSRVILIALGVDDYGLYNIVAGVVLILGFLNNSMTGATQRFLNVELGKSNAEGVRLVFDTARTIHLLVAVVILCFGETIGLWFLNSHMNIDSTRIIAANWIFQFALASFVVTVISVPYNACIIAHEKMSAFAYISVVEALLKLVIVFLLYILPGDRLIVYGLLMTLTSVIIRLIYGQYCKRHFEECRTSRLMYDKKTFKAMLGFSGWTIFGALGTISHTQGIGVIINMFFGVAVNAAQGVSSQVIRLVNMFTDNFMTALKPQIVKTYAQGNFEAMHSLVIRGSKIGICLVSLFVVPLLFEIPLLLDIWLDVVPNYSVEFIRIILVTTLCSSFAYPLATARAATGKIRNYQIVLTTMAWMHLPTAWWFYYLGYPPQSAMIVYLVIIIIEQIYRIFDVCPAINLSKIKFVKDVLLKCSFAIVVALGLTYTLDILLPDNVAYEVLLVFLSFLTTATTIWSIAMSTSERAMVLSFVRTKINYNKTTE